MIENVTIPIRFWSIKKYLKEDDETYNMLYVLFHNCADSFQALKKVYMSF